MIQLPDIQLSERDQRAIFVGLVFLFLFCVVTWIIVPVFEKGKKLHRIFVQKKAALTEMEILAGKYARMSGSPSVDGKHSLSVEREFSLFSFIDTQARDSGVKENVVYMRPFTRKDRGGQDLDMVDIKLSSVYLSSLVQFLSCIESEPYGVRIHSLSLTRTISKKGGPMLDVLMETAVPVPGENGRIDQ